MNRFQMAGKLGSIKSQETHQRNKKKRVEEYNNHPKYCLFCKGALRYTQRKRKFCSHRCVGNYQAVKNGWNIFPQNVLCKNCNNQINSPKKRQFCCLTCNNEYRKKETRKKIESCIGNRNGVGIRQFRHYLIEKCGAKCIICGWSKENEFSKTVPIVMNHIDGNPENYNLKNLELLCPNCDSLTSTYKGLNKGKGRHSRKMRYRSGKSF